MSGVTRKGGAYENSLVPIVRMGTTLAAGCGDGRTTAVRKGSSSGSFDFFESSWICRGKKISASQSLENAKQKDVKVGEERTGPDKAKDVLLRESSERVLVGAVEDLLAHPVASALCRRLQDEVTECPRAHVVGCRSGRGLATDGPEEEPGAACVGVVPGGVRLATEHVVWQGFEWRRIFEPARPVAGHWLLDQCWCWEGVLCLSRFLGDLFARN